MNTSNIHPPLSNIQAEFLLAFGSNIPDKHLAELKKVIARFLLEKARDKADAVWDTKGYTDDALLKIIDQH